MNEFFIRNSKEGRALIFVQMTQRLEKTSVSLSECLMIFVALSIFSLLSFIARASRDWLACQYVSFIYIRWSARYVNIMCRIVGKDAFKIDIHSETIVLDRAIYSREASMWRCNTFFPETLDRRKT